MNILLLGDIFGPAGRKAIIEKLPSWATISEYRPASGLGESEENIEQLYFEI